MEEYGIMEYLELAVTRCGRWTGNREFIWSGLSYLTVAHHPTYAIFSRYMVNSELEIVSCGQITISSEWRLLIGYYKHPYNLLSISATPKKIVVKPHGTITRPLHVQGTTSIVYSGWLSIHVYQMQWHVNRNNQ